MSETIKYEVDSRNENRCITDCPNNQRGKCSVRKVGSWSCSTCPHFISLNDDTKTVDCGYESEVK